MTFPLVLALHLLAASRGVLSPGGGEGELVIRYGEHFPPDTLSREEAGLLPFVVQGGNRSLRVEFARVPCVGLRMGPETLEYAVSSLLEVARGDSPAWSPVDTEEPLMQTVASLFQGFPVDEHLEAVLTESCLHEPCLLYIVPQGVLHDIGLLREARGAAPLVPAPLLAILPRGPG